MSNTLYDRDFAAWAHEQAALLRSGHLSKADIDHIAEEIESMGRTEKRELVSRLGVLPRHLLQRRYQPDRRGASWQTTIRVQRRALARHLRDNPSLKASLSKPIDEGYGDAVIEAAGETDLPEGVFPATCPWGFDQFMDPAFWPDEGD